MRAGDIETLVLFSANRRAPAGNRPVAIGSEMRHFGIHDAQRHVLLTPDPCHVKNRSTPAYTANLRFTPYKLT